MSMWTARGELREEQQREAGRMEEAPPDAGS